MPELKPMDSVRLHADFGKRVVLAPEEPGWAPSPMPGVERRMLDRIGDEVARATSIVRYSAGSRFAAHEHDKGEEFLVLNGIFSDEHGDYPSGAYVRNPNGSRHAPFSERGCTIFVKLRQFAQGDRQHKVLRPADMMFRPGLVAGLEVMPLHQFGSEQAALVRWRPGTEFRAHRHWGGEEILVLEGVFEDEHGVYPAGSWIRSPHRSVHNPFSRAGCLLYVKTGHLPSKGG